MVTGRCPVQPLAVLPAVVEEPPAVGHDWLEPVPDDLAPDALPGLPRPEPTALRPPAAGPLVPELPMMVASVAPGSIHSWSDRGPLPAWIIGEAAEPSMLPRITAPFCERCPLVPPDAFPVLPLLLR